MAKIINPVRWERQGFYTGRRCPHSGKGEDFLTGQPNFFTETAVTPERKVKKWLSRWEMNGLSEGYKRAVDFKVDLPQAVKKLLKMRDFEIVA